MTQGLLDIHWMTGGGGDLSSMVNITRTPAHRLPAEIPRRVPADRRPIDPLLRAADAALHRAAVKAQERARASRSEAKPQDTRRG